MPVASNIWIMIITFASQSSSSHLIGQTDMLKPSESESRQACRDHAVQNKKAMLFMTVLVKIVINNKANIFITRYILQNYRLNKNNLPDFLGMGFVGTISKIILSLQNKRDKWYSPHKSPSVL